MPAIVASGLKVASAAREARLSIGYLLITSLSVPTAAGCSTQQTGNASAAGTIH